MTYIQNFGSLSVGVYMYSTYKTISLSSVHDLMIIEDGNCNIDI